MAPAAAGVELADQIQQPGGGGVQVGGELGDLVAEAAQLRECFKGKWLDRGINARRLNSMTSPS